jgi:hypothetical protein
VNCATSAYVNLSCKFILTVGLVLSNKKLKVPQYVR